MKQTLLHSDRFLKVNSHCHTTLSDGKMTPEEVKEIFKARGYDAVAYTDHNVLFDHGDLCDDTFTAINGYEVNITGTTSQIHLDGVDPLSPLHRETVHINFYPRNQRDITMVGFAPEYLFKNQRLAGMEEQVKYTGDGHYFRDMTPEGICSLIAEANALGQYSSFNHPRWSMNTHELYTKLQGVSMFELANGDCIRNSDMDYAPHVYEQMMRNGIRVPAIAGDDNHNLEGIGLAWTMVASADRSASAILDAMAKGDCYATCGPDFSEIWVEENAVHVRTSPVVGIYMTTAGRRTAHVVAAEGEELYTEAVFPLRASDLCFRLQLRDTRGNRASSRFYYLDELSPDVLHFDA